MRPKLLVEKAMDKEISWNDIPRIPHCDPRILHLPSECKYCEWATVLQEEREQLNVSNTGHANRLWPCPAERARSLETMHIWTGNQPKLDVDELPEATVSIIEVPYNNDDTDK